MNPTRHILCMSGGKDSTALALYMRDRVPEMEYVFCDTDKELTETYEYLNRVRRSWEEDCSAECQRRASTTGLRSWRLSPSANMRWCTKMLKAQAFRAICWRSARRQLCWSSRR